jgi:hypothetical protein
MGRAEKPVQRNFLLPRDQAEWLREHAFRTRRKQAEVVREALAEYRSRAEVAGQGGTSTKNRLLVERFRSGAGVDLDLLDKGGREMWDLDA